MSMPATKKDSSFGIYATASVEPSIFRCNACTLCRFCVSHAKAYYLTFFAICAMRLLLTTDQVQVSPRASPPRSSRPLPPCGGRSVGGRPFQLPWRNALPHLHLVGPVPPQSLAQVSATYSRSRLVWAGLCRPGRKPDTCAQG